VITSSINTKRLGENPTQAKPIHQDRQEYLQLEQQFRAQAEQAVQLQAQVLAAERAATNAALQQENEHLRAQLVEAQAALLAAHFVVPVLPAVELVALPAPQPAIAVQLVVEAAMPGVIAEQQPAQPEPALAPAPIVAFYPGNPAAVLAPVQEVMQQQAQPVPEAVQQVQAAPIPALVTGGSILVSAQKRKR